MTDDTPLYLQVEARLRQGLAIGTWPADQALPPERQLAEELGVSRRTLRKALERLEDEGAVIRKRGSGTYAASIPAQDEDVPRLHRPLQTLTSFTEDMRARGHTVTSRWLIREITAATPDEALALAISPTARVARLKRLRFADDEPVGVELAVLPAEIAPEPEKIEHSLYSYLDVTNSRPVRALQHIRAMLMPAKEAELLQIPPTEPALFTRRVTYHASGRPIEFTRSFYRADRYDFVVEIGGR
ncbi:GntR family transcriptional regulator [Deinococcus yavapaiensis]|nr:GntR family transcriptional regulator [Deinococcus yavapaiensis]